MEKILLTKEEFDALKEIENDGPIYIIQSSEGGIGIATTIHEANWDNGWKIGEEIADITDYSAW